MKKILILLTSVLLICSTGVFAARYHKPKSAKDLQESVYYSLTGTPAAKTKVAVFNGIEVNNQTTTNKTASIDPNKTVRVNINSPATIKLSKSCTQYQYQDQSDMWSSVPKNTDYNIIFPSGTSFTNFVVNIQKNGIVYCNFS